jgi:hypothetical protein
MVGTYYINVNAKVYQATAATLTTMINSLATYTLVFTLEDSLLSTGYFVINIPPELTIDPSITATITSQSLNSNPSATPGINSITLANINSTELGISNQTVTINIIGLVQPSSVKPLSNF